MSEAPPPTDLRLVPAAVAAWGAAAAAVSGSARTVALAAAVALVGVTVPVVIGLCHQRGSPHLPDPQGPPLPPTSQRSQESPGSGGLRVTAWLALVAVAAVLASSWAQLHLREAGLLPRLIEARATVDVVGVVRSEPVAVVEPWALPAETGPDDPAAAGRYRTELAVEHVTGRGRHGAAGAGVLVLGGPGWRDVAYGARVAVTGRLAPGEPADELRGVLVGLGDVRLVEDPGWVDRQVKVHRDALLAVTDDLPADARGLVPGAAIGDTSRLPADLRQAMRDTSLTHITAVSGGHFAVLSVTVLGLTAVVGAPRLVRAGAAGLAMAGFVLLVHPEPSVLRAAAMGAVAVTGLVLGRSSRAVPALGTAVVGLLVMDPWLARTYGFVLSVLATGAIVLLAPRLVAAVDGWVPRWLAVAVAVPVAAQAVCAPVVVLLDPAVAVYAVPANLLASVALLPATVLGVGATAVAPWLPGVAEALARGAAGATWWIAWVARTAANLPGARHEWPGGPGGAAVLTVATGLALLAVLRVARVTGRARRARAVVAVAVCVAVTLVLSRGAG